jgi:uncharacterized protein YegJ (DUF2314 family)
MAQRRSSKTRKAKASSSTPRGPAKKKEKSDAKLYGALAALVVGLVALVWWSLPRDYPVAVTEEAESGASAEGEEPLGPKGRKWSRPAFASAEFAVVTDRPMDVVQKLATVAEIASLLEARHCGPACDAVRKFMSDEEAFEIEIRATEEIILPPKDTLDTVAPGLTPAQREKVHDYPTSVRIRTRGDITPEVMPARAGFAAAAALAEALDGFVYDEASRRIETARDFASHTVTAKLGEPAFARRQIVVQLYRQEDGTTRLLTLGMARYGSPDISLRGANMPSGPLLAEVLNAAASKLAHGHEGSTITITLEDVASVVGKKPEELNPSPASARAVLLGIVEPERQDGDPDNELAELVPEGGSSREAWDAVVKDLFGEAPSLDVPENDAELAAVAERARKTLPDAIRRFQAGEGKLFVKGPFPIPSESRVDGGAATELLWLAAASCDAVRCVGTLSNEPTYATNLAAGKTTSVQRSEAVDWMIEQKDGGTLGGESIKVLTRRAMN